MRFRFNSIRERLFFIFLIFILFIVLVGTIGIWFYDRGMQLTNLITSNEKAMIKILQVVKLEQDFLDDDLNNTSFFKNKKSEFIQKHDSLLGIAKSELKEINELDYFDYDYKTHLLMESHVDTILDLLAKQNQIFKTITNYVLERGYQEYGLEGKMRSFIGALEDKNAPFDPAKILNMRRHENDYFLRKDIKYAIKLEYIYKDILKDTENNPVFSTPAGKKAISDLNQYFNSFHNIMVLELKIGLNNQTGLRQVLKNKGNQLAASLEYFNGEVSKEVRENRELLQNILIIIIIISLLTSILVSYLVAYFITRPVMILSNSIIEIVRDIFESEVEADRIDAKDEVTKLQQAFNLMIREIQKQLVEIKETTSEMEVQNKELNNINFQISKSEEKMRSLNKVKDKLFSILSHDLRSPLHSITGFLDVLSNHADAFSPIEIQGFARDMDKSVKRILQLLDNLLNWSLSQTGELDFKPEKIDLNESFEENVELYHKSANIKGVSLQIEAEEELSVFADRNMLDSVLRNLISNAIKFTKEGDSILVKGYSLDDKMVEIIVSDNGIGIKQDMIGKLFQSDEQISTLGTSQEKGTGFGLLLCKEFIEKNNGTIQLRSEEGKGTEVSFTLPILRQVQSLT